MKPIDPLITRALKRAENLLQQVLIGPLDCRELVRGEKPSDIRKELEETRQLLERLQPRRKGATS